MGINRRYADAIDARMNERVLQSVATSGKLQTLTPLELRLDGVPLTIDPRPRRKVKAWVRFGDTPIRVDAVGVVFVVDDRQYRCWVWNGAVDEIL